MLKVEGTNECSPKSTLFHIPRISITQKKRKMTYNKKLSIKVMIHGWQDDTRRSQQHAKDIKKNLCK